METKKRSFRVKMYGKIVIRSYRTSLFGYRRWQWRCSYESLLGERCSGAGTAIVRHETAFEAGRVHAWHRHGVRL